MRIVTIIPSTCSKKNLPLILSCIKSLEIKGLNTILLNTIIVSNRKNNSANINFLKISKKLFVNKNIGYGEMNNIAIETAIKIYNPDYILFINDDARVDKSFFKTLLNILAAEDPDIIIPLVYNNNDNNIDSFGLKYYSSGYSSTVKNLTDKSGFASGSLFIVKKLFLDQMKKSYGFYFNPIYYYYFEDLEFSIRANGLCAEIKQYHNLTGYHLGSRSTNYSESFKYFYTYRNLIWVIISTWPTNIIIKNIIKIIILQTVIFIMLTVKFGFCIYFKIFRETLQNIKILLSLRENILNRYNQNFDFNKLLDKRIICTKKNICI